MQPIGGLDGLAPALKATATEPLCLSDQNPPQALPRVLLADALKRAVSPARGRP